MVVVSFGRSCTRDQATRAEWWKLMILIFIDSLSQSTRMKIIDEYVKSELIQIKVAVRRILNIFCSSTRRSLRF